MDENIRQLLLQLGQTQIDAMFARQIPKTAIDDLDLLPLIEEVVTAFERTEGCDIVAEELWEHAYVVYDRMCKEAEPESTTEQNRELMQSYLSEGRQSKRRRRSGQHR